MFLSASASLTTLLPTSQFSNPTTINSTRDTNLSASDHQTQTDSALKQFIHSHPPHLASIWSNQNELRKLIEQGLDPFTTTNERENCFHFCAAYGHTSLLVELIEKNRHRPDFLTAINYGDFDGLHPLDKETPLHYAVRNSSQPEIVRILLDAGASPLSRSTTQNTPLHLAAITGCVETARLLLQKGADINAFDQQRKTPLDLALQTHQDQMSLFLIDPLCYQPSSLPEVSGKDMEGFIYHAFEQSYLNGESEKQILYLEQLSSLYLDRKDYLKAACLLNSAFHIAQSYEFDSHYIKRLYFKMENLEVKFLQEELGIKDPVVERGYIERNRQRIKDTRNTIEQKLNNEKTASELQTELTSHFEAILKSIILNGMDQLNSIVPKGKYTVLGLGSLSRKEMSPYSDVEFAFLLSDPYDKNYFRQLARLLEIKIVNLGETSFDIIRSMKIGDNILPTRSLCPKGFSMDMGGLSPLGKTGVYELIGTSNVLAKYQSEEWLNSHSSEIIMVNAMRTPSRVMGDEGLYQEYLSKAAFTLKKKITPQNTEVFKKRAHELLEGHIREFGPSLAEERVCLRAFNTKRDFYRPFQMILESLSLYYNLSSTTTPTRIAELKEKKIIPFEGAKNLQKAFEIAIRFRFQIQLFYRAEEENMIYVEDEQDRHYFPIKEKETAQILELYKVLIPFHKATTRFLKDKKALVKSVFYDKKIGCGGEKYENNFDYENANVKYAQAAALNPNQTTLMDLGRVKTTLSETMAALDCHTRAFAHLKRKFGDRPHQDMVVCLNELGIDYLGLGDFAKSVNYFQQSIKMSEQINEPKSKLSVAISFGNLGLAYQRLGDLKEAIKFLKKSIDLLSNLTLTRKSYSFYATVLNNLGTAYYESDQKDKAVSCIQKSIEIIRLIGGKKTQLDLAKSLNNLALLFASLDYEKALALSEKALKILKEFFPTKSHIEIARVLSNRGMIFMSSNENKKAITDFKDSLKMLESLLSKGIPHPDVVAVLCNLGMVYLKIDRKNKAAHYFEQALAMLESVYNQQPSLVTRKILDQLGALYNDLSKPQEAIKCFEKSLALYKEANPDLASLYNNLATSHMIAENFTEALKNYEKSYEIYQKLSKDASDSTLTKLQVNLGLVHDKLGNHQRALTFFSEILNKEDENIPYEVMEAALYGKATSHFSLQEFDQVVILLKSLLKIQEDDSNCVMTLSSLSQAYCQLNQPYKAIECLTKVLDIQTKLYSTIYPPPMISTFNGLGYSYSLIKDHANTIKFCAEALKIIEFFFGKNDELSISPLANMADAHFQLGQTEKSITLYLRLLKLSQKAYPDRPDLYTIPTRERLREAYLKLGDITKANAFI